jgi:hypothetical protein
MSDRELLTLEVVKQRIQYCARWNLNLYIRQDDWNDLTAEEQAEAKKEAETLQCLMFVTVAG